MQVLLCKLNKAPNIFTETHVIQVPISKNSVARAVESI